MVKVDVFGIVWWPCQKNKSAKVPGKRRDLGALLTRKPNFLRLGKWFFSEVSIKRGWESMSPLRDIIRIYKTLDKTPRNLKS